MGRKYLGWKRGGEEGGKAGLQDAEGCCEKPVAQYLYSLERVLGKRCRVDLLLPSFKVRSSGGVASGLTLEYLGVRREGLLEKQISGKISRFE